MKRLLVISVFLTITGFSQASADSIYGLIKKGKLQQARDSLSQLASAATREGDMLFCQAMVESSAPQSARLYQAALDVGVSSRYREELYYRLAQYYLLLKDHARVSQLLAEYFSRWEQGRYQSKMIRLSILTDELMGQHESALNQCDRFLLSRPDDETEQWGQIDKARILADEARMVGSVTQLRTIARARSGPGIPLALYLLGNDAVAKKRADDAVFYYNLLREGYPHSVGLDDLVKRLGGLSDPVTNDDTAERITGTFYSVKVGVFSEKSNARRQADRFRAYDKKVEIRTKTISGRKYQVVYVGHFSGYNQALGFKKQIEAAFGEAYQVITR